MLKRVLGWLIFASLALGVACAAENPFLGTWKMNSSKSRTPDEMKIESLGKNKYTFNFGPGAETIVANGKFQPGFGATLLSVKSEAPDTWIVERKLDGNLIIRATWKLSNDGSTLTDNFIQYLAPENELLTPPENTLSVNYVYKRNGEGQGIAGDWKSIKETWVTPIILEVTAFEGDGLRFSIPAELDVKNARLNGKEYPDPTGGITTSIHPVDEHNLQMTNKFSGAVLDTREIAVSADGKTLTLTVHTQGKSAPDLMVFERQ